MRRHRRAKIIATLGPATSSPEKIEELFNAGVDVFRLNFSHGTHQDHQKSHQIIRELDQRTGHPITILMDLQGPKLRVGTFANGGVELHKGQDFQFHLNEKRGNDNGVQLPHPEIFQTLEVGTEVLLDDGRIRAIIKRAEDDLLRAEILVGGYLSDRKGLNIPGIRLPISALTDKDRADLEFGLDMGVDWVALSFVQHPDDVLEARNIIGERALLMSKLEKPEAILHLEDIVDCSDAIMVARGDLGVELPPEDVPLLQKRIISACRRAGKPVAVATQMLDSMISSPSPTRAEASDVATAIYEEADAVMLSAESAHGQYPVEAVTMMDRIIRRVEGDPDFVYELPFQKDDDSTAAAITQATRQVAQSVKAKAVATFTTTGNTTFLAAKARPTCPIMGITPHQQVARRLGVAWGVYPIQCHEIQNLAEAVACALNIAKRQEFAEIGDRIVVTAGVPFKVAGTTNVIRIAELSG